MDFSTIERVLEVLQRHEQKATRVINMVPSENSLSALARLPMLLDVYHRYFFNASGAPDQWSFRGSQDVGCLEVDCAVRILKELTGAAHVNVRPLSGLSGMAMVLSALGGNTGSTVLSVSPEQGGHYATAKLAGRLGLVSRFMTGPDAHTIDYDAVADVIRTVRPTLVYVDQSNCLFPLDVARLVEVTRSTAPETIVHIDCSHWLGLVLGGAFPNPLALGADSFGGSTHKTFPGPHKAIVATNRGDLADRLYQAQFEMISSHHFAATISLGIALVEFKECGGREYAANVIANAKHFGKALSDAGLHVVAAERGFSAGHQIWIRTGSSGIDAFDASDRLYAAGIRVNAFEELPGIRERVIRVGVNEATYHGLHGDDMRELADIFVRAVTNAAAPDALARRTAELRSRYREPYAFPSDDPKLSERIASLFASVFPDVALGSDSHEPGRRNVSRFSRS